MITLKIPYKSNDEFKPFLNNLRREYSSLVRYSYNRLKEGISEKDIRSLHKSLNNVNNIDAWTRQCSINEAKQILNKHNDKVIFGGKNNLIKYLKGVISKESYKDSRLLPLNIFGEKANLGNRKFKLDLTNNKIIYKHSRKEHFELEIPNLRGSYKQLYNLESNPRTYSVKLTDKHLLISFEEETKECINLLNNRYIGIDLNPEFIGISVKEEDNILFTKLYSVKQITDKIIKLKVKSSEPKYKHLNNKLNHEILEISKDISEISKQFNCKYIFIEDLSFSGSSVMSRFSNRKNKNLWKRDILINNLTKRCNINNQKLFKINPAYSSFIGNLQYNFEDPINASLEIGRRGYECIIKRNKQFYPELKLKEELISQWKDKINLDSFKNWKELFNCIKNLELRYRVSTDVVFSKFKTEKSYVKCISHYSC